MNKQRRSALAKVADDINSAMMKLEDIKNDEQDAFDNLPESIQDSERGSQMEENIENMEDGISYLQDALDSISEVD